VANRIYFDCQRDIKQANLDLDFVVALIRCGIDFEELEPIWRKAYDKKKLAVKTLGER
jgi:hypothetical protein